MQPQSDHMFLLFYNSDTFSLRKSIFKVLALKPNMIQDFYAVAAFPFYLTALNCVAKSTKLNVHPCKSSRSIISTPHTHIRDNVQIATL